MLQAMVAWAFGAAEHIIHGAGSVPGPPEKSSGHHALLDHACRGRGQCREPVCHQSHSWTSEALLRHPFVVVQKGVLCLGSLLLCYARTGVLDEECHGCTSGAGDWQDEADSGILEADAGAAESSWAAPCRWADRCHHLPCMVNHGKVCCFLVACVPNIEEDVSCGRGWLCQSVCVGGEPAGFVCHLGLALLHRHDISVDGHGAAVWACLCGCGPCKCWDHHSGEQYPAFEHACNLLLPTRWTCKCYMHFVVQQVCLYIVCGLVQGRLLVQVWCDITGCLITCVTCKLILDQLAHMFPLGS